MRRTKIVATLGPASSDPVVLKSLLAAGVDTVRLNLSHGTVEDHRATIRTVKTVREAMGLPVAILLDTRGPEVRLESLEPAPVQLVAGDVLALGRWPGAAKARAEVSWDGLYALLEPNTTVWLDDGRLELTTLEAAPDGAALRVIAGGPLAPHKKVMVKDREWPLPVLTGDDQADLRMGLDEAIDAVAVSFVRSADDLFAVRRFLEESKPGTPPPPLIAKIENHSGVAHLHDILRASDGVMVARGDLGIELPLPQVPWLQKRMVRLARQLGIPSIIATQMLESMIREPVPTRAEVSDVANAIWDGADAVMLSGETATGRDPVGVVRTMATIAEEAERHLPEPTPPRRSRMVSVSAAVSQAAAELAEHLEAKAIISATASGHTARMLSRVRPRVPILAYTPSALVARRLALVWGVRPQVLPAAADPEQLWAACIAQAQADGHIQEGDRVVLTAGVAVGIPGSTNLIRVETVAAQPILRGQGIVGEQPVTGPVWHYRGPDSPDFAPGVVLVAHSTDAAAVPFMERAAAVVVETGGLTSHAAVVGVTLQIPTVVGVEHALAQLSPGMQVTVDGHRGLIFAGSPRI